MTYWPNAFEYFTVTRSTAGLFAASAGKVPLEDTTVGVSGQIQGSLWEAMISQGTPPEMIYRFAELFGWRIDFLTEPRKGDTYKLIWKRHKGSGAIKDGAIVCAYYNRSREKGEFYAFPLAGDYFDQEGDSLRGEFLRARRLAYRRISSRFYRAPVSSYLENLPAASRDRLFGGARHARRQHWGKASSRRRITMEAWATSFASGTLEDTSRFTGI